MPRGKSAKERRRERRAALQIPIAYPQAAEHGPPVKCDGCGYVARYPHEDYGPWPCPRCGCETGTYA